ncbi:MAG: hypothetical protein BECKG1743E_GA0114224_1000316, partial [Candidatus Kentron sp. G]
MHYNLLPSKIIIRLPCGPRQGNRMMISQIGNNIKTINISMLLSN